VILLIEISTLLLYTTGAFVIIVSPGPDFLYVATRGIAQGSKAGILSAAGISIGLIFHTVLAAFGLSAILNTSDIAFQTVKYIGAGYLFYLGIKTIFSKGKLKLENDDRKMNNISIVRQGIFTNVFNPKAIVTFMAFIPQFVNPLDKNATIQIILLGGIISFLAVAWFGLVGFFSGYIGLWLSKNVLYQKIIRYLSGSVLIFLGLRLVLTKRTR
jgi:threonine/homoserine/homoserine lactone efflux protein